MGVCQEGCFMPIDPEAQHVITLRLRLAHEETLAGYAQRPLRNELLGDIVLGQEWPAISAAYSGIEQTLKFLIALDKGLTVDELLVKDGIVENPDEEPNRRTKYLIHRLGTLFSRLDPGTRDIVEREYAIWQSLYDSIPICRCADFLGHIQGDRDQGHLDWRYCLIQGNSPPQNSADAMLAIWALLVRRCEARAGHPHRSSTRTANEEVADGLRGYVEVACTDAEKWAVENNEPIGSLREEYAAWAPTKTCLVNNMAALIGHCGRYGHVSEDEGSESWTYVLAHCVRRLLYDARQGKRGPLFTFVRRALGYSPTGESVRWNPDARRFQSVPWPLRCESSGQPPVGATRVESEDDAAGRLQDIWHHARIDGYEVKETRAFAAHRPDGRWYLRMRVFDRVQGTEQACFSVWQHHSAEGPIAIEEHASDLPPRPGIALWLLRCKHPVRGRWLAPDASY